MTLPPSSVVLALLIATIPFLNSLLGFTCRSQNFRGLMRQEWRGPFQQSHVVACTFEHLLLY